MRSDARRAERVAAAAAARRGGGAIGRHRRSSSSVVILGCPRSSIAIGAGAIERAMARRSACTDQRSCFAFAAQRSRPPWRRPRGKDLEIACRIRISSLNHSEVTDPRGDGLVDRRSRRRCWARPAPARSSRASPRSSSSSESSGDARDGAGAVEQLLAWNRRVTPSDVGAV